MAAASPRTSGAPLRLAVKVISTVFRKGPGIRLFVCLRSPAAVDGKTRAIHARILTPERVALATRDRELDLPESFVKEAVEAGHVCVGVMDGARVASYCWLASSPTELFDGLVLHPPIAARYVYKGYTDARMRGQGLLGACLDEARRLAAEAGANDLITIVEQSNLSSLRACYKQGFQRFGHFYFFSRAKRAVASRGCRRRGVSFGFANER
jgi:GNAT superfamily N-acetyltransferase